MAKGEYGCQDDVLRVLPPTLAAKHPDLNDDADNDSHEEKRSVFELELEETEAKHGQSRHEDCEGDLACEDCVHSLDE